MKFELYRQRPVIRALGIIGGATQLPDWRWRLRAHNGQVVADGGEGYRNRQDCINGIFLVIGTNNETPLIDLTAPGGLSQIAANGFRI